MADITLTFEGGKQHIYQNAPDTLSPDDVYLRAQKDFPDQKITGISRKVSDAKPRAEAPTAEFAAPVQPEIPQVRKAGLDVGAKLAGRALAPETRASVQVPTAGQLARDYAATAKATGAELGKETLPFAYLFPTTLPFALNYGGKVNRYLESVEKQAGKEYPQAVPTAKALTTALGLYPFGLGAKAAPEILGEVPALTRGAGEIIRTARGIPAKETAERVRGSILEQSRPRAKAAEAEAARLAEQQRKIEERARQVGAGRPITEQRFEAQQKALLEKERRKGMGSSELRTRGKVLDDLRDAERASQSEVLRATGDVNQARALEQEAAQRLAGSENALEQLNSELARRPGMTDVEYGQAQAAVIDKYVNEKVAARSQQSGYGKAIKDAGTQPRVKTSSFIENVDNVLARTRNPELIRILSYLKKAAKTGSGKEAVNALSVESSDSLIKYMDKIISSKQFEGLALDKETLNFVRDFKKQLVKNTGDAWKPYLEARGKWATLSRPLDVIERNLKLRKVVQTDPFSQERKLALSDIAGAMIRNSKKGEPAFARMIEYDPSLKDASRLYFSRLLFGKETAPTTTQIRKFLYDYETPLRQSGLYNEFRDLRSAKETAERAVLEAKGEVAEMGKGVKAAKEAEKIAGERATSIQKLREKAAGRYAETLKTTEPVKDLAARITRQQKAQEELGKKAGLAKTAAEQAGKKANIYRTFESEITQPGLTPKEIGNKAEVMAKKLVDEQLISQNEYQEFLRQISPIREQQAMTREMQKKLLKYATALIGGTAAEEITRRIFF
jgi:hypothetical protein